MKQIPQRHLKSDQPIITRQPILARKGRYLYTVIGMIGMIWLLLMLASKPALAQGPICRVDQGVTVPGSGDSWTNAYQHLQDALIEANCTEIWVAAGIYRPDEGSGQSDNDPNSTFPLKPDVAIYGGFTGTETNRNQRDWATNLTVLSGDIDGNDIVEANGILTDTSNIIGTNAYHVLVADGTTGTPIAATTRLDGFTITAGHANGTLFDSEGGGLHCDGRGSGNRCSPTLANLTFSGNLAGVSGGALFNNGDSSESSPTLINVIFAYNRAGSFGGALFNDGLSGDSSPVLTNVLFSQNVAGQNGGAIYNDGREFGRSSPVFTNVTLAGNSAGQNGGSLFNDGFNGGTSSPRLTNVILWDNSASSQGQQIYNLFATPVISYTLIQSSTNDITDNNGAVTWGAQILTSDPRFVDSTKGDLRLQVDSTAIDMGLNRAVPLSVTTDLAGNQRIQGLAVDLGAYEVTPTVEITLTVERQGSMRVLVGTVVTYHVTITNIGAVDVTLTGITGAPQAIVAGTDPNAPCTTPITVAVAGSHHCTLTWVAAGSGAVDFQVTVNGNAGGTATTASNSIAVVVETPTGLIEDDEPQPYQLYLPAITN